MDKMTYHSQYKQDQYIHETLFNSQIQNGIFVDIGAHDGQTLSNTLFFEKLGWTGICIEPIPEIFQKLKESRKCECLEGCVSAFDEPEVDFCRIKGYNEMLSGIENCYDINHAKRINDGFIQYKDTFERIKVKNYKFNDVIKPGLIHYLSLDTEGSELDILKSIDWEKYNILTMSVENNNPNDKRVMQFLFDKGYAFAIRCGCDEIFFKL